MPVEDTGVSDVVQAYPQGANKLEPPEDRKPLSKAVGELHRKVGEGFHPIVGDPEENPRFFDGPTPAANEIFLEEGKPAPSEIWAEVWIVNSKTPTYILRYHKGDMVPDVWDLPPAGSFEFTPDLAPKPTDG